MPPLYKGRDKRDVRSAKDKGVARQPGAKLKRAWRIAKAALVVAMIAAVVLAVHIHRVDRMIQEKFDRPQKWNLPSRIYSDASYLYRGIDIAEHALVTRLDRLGYRNIGDQIRNPGDYALAKGRIDIYLHDFDYPFEKFRGFPIRIALDGTHIASIAHLDNGTELKLVKLEPEEIAAVLDVTMESRTFVTIDEVPARLIEAIVLIEDERFFEHHGVDPIGILRAMAVNVSKLRVVQGGSTLTQQLVKNFFLYPKKSILRKLNEALIALRIERNHTKREILQAYLNEIYLGQRGSSSISGVGEAARIYFAKNVGQLTLGECALLAGMIRSPNQYSPLTKPENAARRRNVVLGRMLEEGFITQAEHDAAAAEPVITPKVSLSTVRAPYFIDFVKKQIKDLYPQEVLEREGLRIFTTLDMTFQRFAERAVADGTANLESSYASILPKDHAGLLQAALIAVQPSNGYVRALVGGRRYADSQFNRATQAKRQPGSTFKPFVYLTAFDPDRSAATMTPATIIDDAPFSVVAGGKNWQPKNYDKKSHGLVSLRKALYMSYNIATAKVALKAGLENVVRTAHDAGIESEIQAVPSMALGAIEVSPMELATAYAIFPNGGLRVTPLSIMNVVTKEGEVLEQKRLSIKRAVDAGPVYLTTSVLKDVLDRGTGRSARALGFDGIAGGKTGTTSNYRDAWFVGFTPNLLALVWVGYDDNATTNMSGTRAALPLWTDFMKRAQPASRQDFASPEDIILVKINPPTGLLVNRDCPENAYEPFIEGTEPEMTCDEFVPPVNEHIEF